MTRRFYRFGSCSIDMAARELRHSGERVSIAPSAFDCIGYLLEQRPRAVGRDELVSAVWGKTSITDSLLGKTLVKARRAVGDNGDEQNVIRTVPRFGYQWVADVSVDEIGAQALQRDADSVAVPPDTSQVAMDGEAALAAPIITAVTTPRRAGRRKAMVTTGVVLAVVAAILVIGFAWHRFTGRLPSSQTTSPAASVDRYGVLPVSVDAGRDEAWLRLGLMDLIANRLRDAGIAVTPSDNVVRVLHPELPAGDAAKTLRNATGASQLVSARIRQAGPEWIMTIQLDDRDGHGRDFEARGNDAISATRLAVDRLLDALGRLPKPSGAGERPLSLTQLSQRVEAAVLVNDFDTARQWITASPADMQALPEMQLRLAIIDYRVGRSQDAATRLQSLIDISSAESAPLLRARALTILGGIALKQSQPDLAESSLTAAVSLLESGHEPLASGHAYMGLGIARAMQARYDEAATALARARVAFELAGDSHALARVDINEGAMDTMRDRLTDALPLLQRAAQRFERLDAPSELINALGNQVEVLLTQLQAAQAVAVSERMVPLLDRLENPMERRVFLAMRARALEAVGRSAEARVILGELVATLDPGREARLLAQIRALQAKLDYAVNQPATAGVLALQAVDGLLGAEYARGRAQAWHLAIVSLLERQRVDEASAETDRYLQWATGVQSAAADTLSKLAQAELAAARQHPDAAERYAAALQNAQNHDVPADIATVASAYGRALIKADRLSEASDISGRISRWADRDYACALLQLRLYQALGQTDAWRASLERSRVLAGERPIPVELLQAPAPRR